MTEAAVAAIQTSVGKARGLARWVHIVPHCFCLEKEHSFRETENRLEYMAKIRDILALDRDDLPDYSTILTVWTDSMTPSRSIS